MVFLEIVPETRKDTEILNGSTMASLGLPELSARAHRGLGSWELAWYQVDTGYRNNWFEYV